MSVIHFPVAQRRASEVARGAARATSVSEVTPPSRAFSVERIADHFSAGMRPRCRHFKTAGSFAPTSAAKASGEGHKPITSLNERKLAMDEVLGHSVLKRKANLSLDDKKSLGHNVRMAESDIKAQYAQEFIARVKTARIATGKKQWQVAELMNIKQDEYKHFEAGRTMPHHLIGRFCLICNIDPNWLLTGIGQKPLRATHAVEQEPELVQRPKKTKRSKAA